jgi:hypothetical protein
MAKSTTRSRKATTLTASITRSPINLDNLSASHHESFTFDIESIGPAEIKKALADSEIITRMLRDHPEEMTAIFNDFLAGRIDSAKENARKINLTEEAFQEQGGGLLWWFMIGVAAGMIIVAAATSH